MTILINDNKYLNSLNIFRYNQNETLVKVFLLFVKHIIRSVELLRMKDNPIL